MTNLRLQIGISILVLWTQAACTVNYGADPNQPGQSNLSIPAKNSSASGTTIPGAAQILDSEQNVWTLVSDSVMENGTSSGLSDVIELLFLNNVVYADNADDEWQSWDGSTWGESLQNPNISANYATGNLLVDGQLNTWTLASSVIEEDGFSTGSTPGATTLLYYANSIYYENSSGAWFVNFGATWIPQSVDPRSSPFWFNTAIPSQTNSVTFEFDAIPILTGASGENSVIGLSTDVAAAYTDLAVIVAFQPNGIIDVMNGLAYANDVAINFAAGENYHVEMDINILTHIYSVYVTPAGGARTAIATNYEFRSTQATVSSLTSFANYSLAGGILISNASYH